MTIASEIQRIKTNIANAYDALENKGATMPATEDSANLASTVATVPAGGGDEITATNTTGSAVSADDRVWVESGVNATDIQGTVTTSTTYVGLAYGNGKFIGINDGSANIVISTDGVNWSSSSTGYSNNWSQIKYFEDKFIAISQGVNNYYLEYLKDGASTWVRKPLVTDYLFRAIAYGNGRYVVVGDNTNGTAYCTNIENGTWTLSHSGALGRWFDVTYGDGKFVAVRYDSPSIEYSTDGVSWTEVALPGTITNAFRIIYANNMFIAFSSSTTGYAYSSDGINWSAGTLPGSASWRNIAYGEGKFFIMKYKSSDIAYSIDGINWTVIENVVTSNGKWQELTYGDSKFVSIPYDDTTTFAVSLTDSYNIIPSKSVTSTSFTGVAQENIANNATGSVKTLLDGNGTYAPTTATKSITTNGTYTASAENAYGLSSVTVDVPTPDVWHNWKNTEYTSNFTNTYTSGSGTAVLSNNNTVLTTSVTGYAYKQLPSRITSISSIETCIKFKPKTALSLLGGDFYFASILNNSNNDYGYGLTINTYNDNPGIGVAAGIGNTNTVTGAITFTVDSYIWLKVYMASSGSYLAYSTDGTNWTTKNITETVSFSNVYGQYIAIGSIKYGMSGTLEYDLSECYVKVNGETVWTPYSETSSEAYTLTASPTTSTQVYEIPKKTSALTITSVGTGTITLSDSKVYNRNSAGDVQSPVLGTKTITSNNTYTAASDYLDGFSSVTVDVPSAPTKKYNLLDRVKDDSNNEIGTVSGFFTDANNVEYAVVCLDAQYRLASGQYLSSRVSVQGIPFSTGIAAWEAKETATKNTTEILNTATSGGYTSTACTHCRSKSFIIDGQTYNGQLPNLSEIINILEKRTEINNLDTTASSFSALIILNDGSTEFWTSTQYTSGGNAWYVYYFGNVLAAYVDNNKFVIPVLEIPNT